MENTKYVIDVWKKYNKDLIVSTFFVNGREYAIKEVKIDENGVPQLSSIESDTEQLYFKLYDTVEEAREYIKKLKRLEGMRS